MNENWSSGYGESFESWQYKKFNNAEYELFLQPHFIIKYLNKIIKIQQDTDWRFYPNAENHIQDYFKINYRNFDPTKIKYTIETELNIVSQIIANYGRSGSTFIKSTADLGYTDKPVLLFYAIEHLSAFFLNMHYNFTQDNDSLSQIMSDQYHSHGISSHQFARIKIKEKLSNLLKYKIKLNKQGFASRFFLSLESSIYKYFIEEKEISLIDLIHTFFLSLRIGIPPKLGTSMIEDLQPYLDESHKLTYNPDIDLFVLYMLSFVFSHLSRYKIYTWQLMITSEKNNIGFYLRYIIDKINELYKRRIFTLIEFYKENIRLKRMF